MPPICRSTSPSISGILGKGQAPGKVILFGEHAVVYGRPALAVPVTQVKAEAVIEPARPGEELLLIAQDLGQEIHFNGAQPQDPLVVAARLTLAELGLTELPPWRVVVRSSIPIASGMGSGAAVSAAIARALANAAGQPLSPSALSSIVYQVEILHHGTPSGIDNSVICYEQPVYFVRGQAPNTFSIWPNFHARHCQHGHRQPYQGGGSRCPPRLGGRDGAVRCTVRSHRLHRGTGQSRHHGRRSGGARNPDG